MDLNCLVTFAVVAHHKSMRRAAQVLHLAQPSVANRISALESELGCPLVTRSRRGVELTPAGEALLPFAEQAIKLLEYSRAAVRYAGDGRAHLVVGATITISTYLMPAIVRAFRRAQPQVDLTIRTGHPEDVGRMLAEGQADLVLTHTPRPQPEVDVVPFARDELILVGVPSGPLAGVAAPGIEELQAAPLVVFTRSLYTRQLIQSAFQALGAEPSILVEVDHVETAKALVRAGLGIAYLPRFAIRRELEEGSLLPVAQAVCRSIPLLLSIQWPRASPRLGLVRAFNEVVLSDATWQDGCPLLERITPP